MKWDEPKKREVETRTWKKRHSPKVFCVALLSLVECDFNVLILETKEILVVFNFHLKQEHAPDRTVFSLWLFCVGRNSLHYYVNAELGILRTLSLPLCVMPVFQRYM